MPLYIGDYIKDTRNLSTIEHGAYLLLIMEYWVAGELPQDETRLARVCGLTDRQWMKIGPVIAGFFEKGWKHKRIEAELERSADISNKRRLAVGSRRDRSGNVIRLGDGFK